MVWAFCVGFSGVSWWFGVVCGGLGWFAVFRWSLVLRHVQRL